MELSNIIFTTIVLFFYYFFNKILLSIFIKSENNLLNDNQFKKPQAFHEIPTYRLGGLTIFIFFKLGIFIFIYLSKNYFSRIHNILHTIFSFRIYGRFKNKCCSKI